MDVFAIYVLKGLLLPPAGNLLLLGLAWFLRARRRVALTLAVIAGATLFLAASPWMATLLARGLETAPAFPLDGPALPPVDAIVVPGTGRYTSAPEYGGLDTVSPRTLERLRYAARLPRRTGWPIATVGGAPLDDETPEGALMAQVLEQDFGVPVRWIEQASRNTAENARNARRLMDVDTILLVTQAMDMPRAHDVRGRRLHGGAGPAGLAEPGRPVRIQRLRLFPRRRRACPVTDRAARIPRPRVVSPALLSLSGARRRAGAPCDARGRFARHSVSPLQVRPGSVRSTSTWTRPRASCATSASPRVSAPASRAMAPSRVLTIA